MKSIKLTTLVYVNLFNFMIGASDIDKIKNAIRACNDQSEQDCLRSIKKLKLSYELLYPSCEFSKKDGELITPIEFAVEEGSLAAVKALVELGVPSDYQGKGYCSGQNFFCSIHGDYNKYTLLHRLADLSRKNKDLLNINKEKEQKHLEILKFLLESAGPALLDKKGSKCCAKCSRSGDLGDWLDNTEFKVNQPITATQLCGSAPGLVCEELRRLRPEQVVKRNELKDSYIAIYILNRFELPPIKVDVKSRGNFPGVRLGHELRAKKFRPCGLRDFLLGGAYDKNKLTNDEMVSLYQQGYKFCQSEL